jgi:hypothetical protein
MHDVISDIIYNRRIRNFHLLGLIRGREELSEVEAKEVPEL